MLVLNLVVKSEGPQYLFQGQQVNLLQTANQNWPRMRGSRLRETEKRKFKMASNNEEKERYVNVRGEMTAKERQSYNCNVNFDF